MRINRVLELISESETEDHYILNKFTDVQKIKTGKVTRYYVPEELRDKVLELKRDLVNFEINEVERPIQKIEEIV